MPLTILAMGVAGCELRDVDRRGASRCWRGLTGSIKVVALPYTFLLMAATVWWARAARDFWRLARGAASSTPTDHPVGALEHQASTTGCCRATWPPRRTPNHISLVSHWFVEMEHAATQMALGLWTTYSRAMGSTSGPSLLAATTIGSPGRPAADRASRPCGPPGHSGACFMLRHVPVGLHVLLIGAAQGNGIVSFDAATSRDSRRLGRRRRAHDGRRVRLAPRLARVLDPARALTLSYWAFQNSSLQWLRWSSSAPSPDQARVDAQRTARRHAPSARRTRARDPRASGPAAHRWRAAGPQEPAARAARRARARTDGRRARAASRPASRRARRPRAAELGGDQRRRRRSSVRLVVRGEHQQAVALEVEELARVARRTRSRAGRARSGHATMRQPAQAQAPAEVGVLAVEEESPPRTRRPRAKRRAAHEQARARADGDVGRRRSRRPDRRRRAPTRSPR